MSDQETLSLLIFVAIALAITLGVNAIICWRLHVCYAALPQQFRRFEPAMVWFLMIPCVPIVYNFFVFPGLSKSYRAYFDAARPDEEVDTADSLAMSYAVLSVCSIIPYIGTCLALGALVVVIIFLVKMNGLKNQISTVDASAFD